MAVLNYRQIPAALASLTPFKVNSMTGETRTPSEYNGGAVYVVISYSTPIAWVYGDGRVVVDEYKYSRTTSRQQRLCRTYLASAHPITRLQRAGVPQEWVDAHLSAV